ncbi:MAG: class I SAM-dependent methyltransferase [Actinomycetota bacterium]|nr:class I SAM-dependent methyltransferase [Actinomycetota bacterium]
MQTGALRPYEDALRTAGPLALHSARGEVIVLDVARWLEPVDAVDETVLACCRVPTLDVGCGPGRFVAALAERGVPALGLDIASTAIALNVHRGTPALLRSVFARVPGEGRWPVALLMDGNIGIGGDPARLLRRLRRVLCASGRLIVETHPDDGVEQMLTVRFSRGGAAIGPQFEWAHVGLRPLLRRAEAAGYRSSDVWSIGGRTFASLGA